MSNTIYKITYDIDNYGDKFYHKIKVDRYHCHEKDKCIIIQSERKRIHKDKIDIITAIEGNNTRGVRYFVWTLDESKIEIYKVKLKEKILKQIEKYKNNISNLEKALELEVTVKERDYSYNE